MFKIIQSKITDCYEIKPIDRSVDFDYEIEIKQTELSKIERFCVAAEAFNIMIEQGINENNLNDHKPQIEFILDLIEL